MERLKGFNLKQGKYLSLLSVSCASLMLGSAPVMASNAAAKTGVAGIQQAQITLTGNVKDDLNEGLPGVNVVVKGTTNGTITDLDGNYTLKNVPANAVITFSYIGFKSQEIPVSGKAVINVQMGEDTEVLGEVVVTALGMKRAEKALGYAVTEIKGDEIAGSNTINPTAALQGKVAGLEISGSDGGIFGNSKVQIRGASTLGGNNQPIYVIDGVILDNGVSDTGNADFNANANDYGNELKNLNPDDFESVSVLKGAAATALYGSRGLNGAIVITTKGGGKFQGFGVSVSQSFGLDHVFSAPKLQNIYGPGTIAGNITHGTNKWDTEQFKYNQAGIPTTIGLSGMHWGPRFDGREVELKDYSMGVYSPMKNNQTDIYQLGFNSNTNVAVKGGNDKTSFYTSASYKYASGTLPNNTFERYSLLVKGSHKISEIVDINASVNLSHSKPRNAARNVGGMFVEGLSRLYNPSYYRNKYLGEHGGIANQNYGDTYANVEGKDLWFEVDNFDRVQKETMVRPQVQVNVKMTDWMRASFEGNMYYYVNSGEQKELGKGYMNEGGYYGMSQSTKEQTTFASTFTFNKDYKEFSFGGFLRGEYWTNAQSEVLAETKDGLVMPGQYFLGNSKGTPIAKARNFGRKHMGAVIFSATAAYKNQYFLEVTGRNDWSSALVYSNKTGNYSYFYPSISGSWLINDTFKLPTWVSLGKIRASWAQVGNDTGAYYINQGYAFGSILQGSGGNIFTNTVPNKLYDPSLKPERKNAFEVGLDWRFINNRYGFDFTFYKENTKDQILEIPAPVVSGISSQLINAGNIENRGIELMVKTTPIQNKDWEWTIDLTYTRNKNKIISLHESVGDYKVLEGHPSYGNYRVGSVAYIGGDYGVLMSDAAPKRDENGNIVLAWNESYRTAYPVRSGEVQKIGKMTPDFLGSVSSGLSWKNLRLNVLLDMRFGGMIASYNNRYGTAYGMTETSLRYRDAANGGVSWISQFEDSKGMQFNDGVIPDGVFDKGTQVKAPNGELVNVGGMSFKDAMDAGYVEPVHASGWHQYNNSWSRGTVNDDWFSEVNYIALREVSLHYSAPANWASKIGARRLGFGFSARNLGYLYNSLPNNLNPEGVRGSSSTNSFMERSFIPYTASYTMSVNVEF